MSQLSDQLHEDARRRFEELGQDLLGCVVAFRDSPSQDSPAFSPNIFTGPPLTDADINGDMHLVWQDRRGKPMGIAVAETGGLRTGLVGPGYAKLEALALSMARVRPFKLTASLEFLRTQIFEWVKERHRGQGSEGCVDYLLRALESAAADHRLLFPVSDLHVQSRLRLGSVTVSTFPERIFEELESKRVDSPSAGTHEFCRSWTGVGRERRSRGSSERCRVRWSGAAGPEAVGERLAPRSAGADVGAPGDRSRTSELRSRGAATTNVMLARKLEGELRPPGT